MSRDGLSGLPPRVAAFHRVARRIMAATGITVVYLLLLGPFRALDAPHDVVPEPVRTIVWWPAQMLHQIPFFGDVMEDYLDFWWMDPNQAETTR